MAQMENLIGTCGAAPSLPRHASQTGAGRPNPSLDLHHKIWPHGPFALA